MKVIAIKDLMNNLELVELLDEKIGSLVYHVTVIDKLLLDIQRTAKLLKEEEKS